MACTCTSDHVAKSGGLRVVEFYAGIGGYHYALRQALGDRAHVVAAIDINTTASEIYRHNFPSTPHFNRNICGMTVEWLDSLLPDIFVLSPPCQPFTRQGLKGDSSDHRTDSFFHLMEMMLGMAHLPRFLVMENVEGFQDSCTRNRFVGILEKLGFAYQEFLLSPIQFGIPNSRLRYYLLAKMRPLDFILQLGGHPVTDPAPLLTALGSIESECSGWTSECKGGHVMPSESECNGRQVDFNSHNFETIQVSAKPSPTPTPLSSTPALGVPSPTPPSSAPAVGVPSPTPPSSAVEVPSPIPPSSDVGVPSPTPLSSTPAVGVPSPTPPSSAPAVGVPSPTPPSSAVEVPSPIPPSSDVGVPSPTPLSSTPAVGVPSPTSLSSAVGVPSPTPPSSAVGVPTASVPTPKPLSHFLHAIPEADLPQYLVPPKVLERYAMALDIATPQSSQCCCFTKAYTHYAVGTGSVLLHEGSPQQLDEAFRAYQAAQSLGREGGGECVRCLTPLKLRYFTPGEVASLMCFPSDFSFPHTATLRQCYKALGNSLNVHVVAVLIKYLFCVAGVV